MFDISLVEMGPDNYSVVGTISERAIQNIKDHLPEVLEKTGMTVEEFIEALRIEMQEALQRSVDRLNNDLITAETPQQHVIGLRHIADPKTGKPKCWAQMPGNASDNPYSYVIAHVPELVNCPVCQGRLTFL